MKIFSNHENEKQYNTYIELLNKPYKLQSLLYHTNNISLHIEYYDIYEDEDKICVSYNTYSPKIGNSSLYLKSMNKTGFTFSKKGSSNSRLKLWFGTSNIQALNIIVETKDVFDFEFDFNKVGYNRDLLDSNGNKNFVYNVGATKGLLSMILCNKVKTKEDYILYYAKNSLRLKKDVIDSFSKEEIVKFIEKFTKYNNQYILRNILITCNNHIEFIKKYLCTRFLPSEQSYDGRNNFIETLKALNKKISWTQSDKDLHELEVKNNIEISNLLKINKIWTQGVTIDLNNKDLFPSIKLSDLPF